MKTHIRSISLSFLILSFIFFANIDYTHCQTYSASLDIPVTHGTTETFLFDNSVYGGLIPALECYDLDVRFTYRERTINGDLTATLQGTPQSLNLGNGCDDSRIKQQTFAYTDPPCFDPATTTFSIDVERDALPGGNTACVDIIVTVELLITNGIAPAAPTYTGAATRNFNTGAADCDRTAQIISYIENNVTDNCTADGDIMVTVTVPPGGFVATCPVMASYIVAFDLEDECGNMSSSSMTATVTDNDVPVITDNTAGPILIPVETACAVSEATVLDSIKMYLTAFDNCDPNPIFDIVGTGTYDLEIDPTVLGCSEMEGITISLMDACGNLTTTLVDIEIIDNSGPTITNNPGAFTIDSGVDLNCVVSYQNVLDSLEMTFGLSATDDCLVDPIPLQYNTSTGGNFNLLETVTGPAVALTDNLMMTCAGSVTRVYMEIFDRCGNRSLDSVDVTVTDLSAPNTTQLTQIWRQVSAEGTNDCIVTLTELEVLMLNFLSDNCTGNSDLSISGISSSPMPTVPGEWTPRCDGMGNNPPYEITYTVTDDCLNAATGIFNLIVDDNVGPSFMGTTQNLTIYFDGSCEADSASIVDQAIAAAYDGGFIVSENCVLDSIIGNVSTITGPACPMAGSFRVDYIDLCGNVNGKDFTFSVEDTTSAVITLPTLVTIDMDANCFVQAFEVKDSIMAAVGYALPTDNCEIVDTIYSYNGNDFNGGNMNGFSLPVTCPATIYKVEVRTVDCGGNMTKDSVEVSVTDKIAPVVDIDTDITMTASAIDGCDLDSAQVVNRLKNNKINSITDACTSVMNDFTYEIIQSGPFSAECNLNEHVIDFVVTDPCGNAWTNQLTLTINQSNPGPSIDLAIENPLPFGPTTIPSGTMLMDPPFPLDATGFTPTDPNDLYGDSPGFGSIYHDDSPINPNPAVAIYTDLSNIPRLPFDILVGSTCGISINDIRDQIINSPALRLSDGCTDSLTLLNTLTVKIRENELDYDLDATNDVDLTDLSCGDTFGLIVEVTDECGNIKTMGFNAQVDEATTPTLVASDDQITISTDNNSCGALSYTDLVESLLDSGLLNITGICDDDTPIVGLWMDNPETAIDDNGLIQDFYAGIFPDNDPGSTGIYELFPQCMPQTDTIYVRVASGCVSLADLLFGIEDLNVSNVVPILVKYVDDVGPEIDIESTQTMTSNSCDLDSVTVLQRLILNKLDGVIDGCNSPTSFSITESGPFSSVCGSNVHDVTFNAMDQCGNVTSQIITITINEVNPEPSVQIFDGITPLGIDIALDDMPFPLPPNVGSSQPDSLYGGNGGALDDANDWHDGTSPRLGSGAPIEISLDMSCGLAMVDLVSQVEAMLTLEDGCTPIGDLMIDVVIRENDTRFDADGTNDIDLAVDASCGLEFGIIVEVTDECGDTDIKGFNAIIVDTIAPVLTAPASLTILRSAVADCRLSPNELRDALLAAGVNTSGLCGDLDLQIWLDNQDTDLVDENGPAGDLYGFDNGGAADLNNRLTADCDAQNLTVYLNATEDCGNATSNTSASITVLVSFIDDLDPVITHNNAQLAANDTITRVEEGDDCMRNVSLSDKFDVDYMCNAGTLSFSSPGISFFQNGAGNDVGMFPVGDHTVTATATDACGNATDTTFTVIILDQDKPDISCNQLKNSLLSLAGSTIDDTPGAAATWDFRVDTDPGFCFAELEFTLPNNVDDECGIATVDISYYDDSGMAPVLIGSDVGALAGGSTHTFFFPSIDLAGDPNADTRVEVVVTDVNGNSKTCDFVVRVRDREAPVAVCTNVTVAVDSFGMATVVPANLVSAGSSDNCGLTAVMTGNTDFTCADIGQTNLTTYNVVDLAGNVSPTPCASLVTVIDTIAPTLTFANNDPNGASVMLNCGDPYVEIFPTLDDNCPVVGNITISGNVDVNVPGTYDIFYNATDASGNPAVTLHRVVIVGNGLTGASLTITGPASVCADTNQSYSFTGVVPSGASTSWSYSGFGGIVTSQSGPTATISFMPGSSSGDVVVTVASGCDFAEFKYAVTIDGPVALCQDITATIDPAVASFVMVTAADIDGGSSSNCGGLTLATIPDPAIYDCSDIGLNTLTLEVSDDSGATSSCTSTVTVVEAGGSPGTIAGDAMVCAGQDGYTYTLSPAPSGPVTWSHSLNNAVIINQGSASVIVNYQDELSLADGYCIVDGNGDPAGTITATYVPSGSCGSAITTSFTVNYMDDEMCSIYNCFIDLHVNTGLSAAGSPDLYTAEERISSDGVVSTGRDIEYIAGQCVELKPGFEVEMSAAFLADIAPCVSQQSFTQAEADVLIDALENDGIKLDRELLNINDEK